MQKLAFVFALFVTAASAQSPREAASRQLQADFKLAAQCSQAVRLIVNAGAVYPNDEKQRDDLVSSTVARARRTGEWGANMPTDIHMLTASIAVDAFPRQSRADWKDLLLADAAAMCALQSRQMEGVASPMLDMECLTDSDCAPSMSCRSKKGGGAMCRPRPPGGERSR
jgi:hypothetical protein